MTDIIIKSPNGEDLSDFIQYTIEQIKTYFIDSIDKKQLARIDQYLKNQPKIVRPNYQYKKNGAITARNILIGAIQNLTFTKTNQEQYRIFINPNAVVPNTQTRFESLLSLIDRGNMELAPYSIWSDTVSYFCEIIPDLYRRFVEEERDVYSFI